MTYPINLYWRRHPYLPERIATTVHWRGRKFKNSIFRSKYLIFLLTLLLMHVTILFVRRNVLIFSVTAIDYGIFFHVFNTFIDWEKNSAFFHTYNEGSKEFLNYNSSINVIHYPINRLNKDMISGLNSWWTNRKWNILFLIVVINIRGE